MDKEVFGSVGLQTYWVKQITLILFTGFERPSTIVKLIYIIIAPYKFLRRGNREGDTDLCTKGGSDLILAKLSLLWGWLNTGTDYLARLQSLSLEIPKSLTGYNPWQPALPHPDKAVGLDWVIFRPHFQILCELTLKGWGNHTQK